MTHTFVVNLANGKVHSLSHEHSRCALSTMKTEHGRRVVLDAPVPKTTQKLLVAIGQEIPLAAWPPMKHGFPKRRQLVACVWCMTWVDEPL